jgi:hypothetical protein
LDCYVPMKSFTRSLVVFRRTCNPKKPPVNLVQAPKRGTLYHSVNTLAIRRRDALDKSTSYPVGTPCISSKHNGSEPLSNAYWSIHPSQLTVPVSSKSGFMDCIFNFVPRNELVTRRVKA